MPRVVTFVCLYGFCSGIFISVTPAAIGQISPQERLGVRIGALFSLTAIATLAKSPVAGVLLRNPEVTKSYTHLISFAISLLITKIDSIKALYQLPTDPPYGPTDLQLYIRGGSSRCMVIAAARGRWLQPTDLPPTERTPVAMRILRYFPI